MLGISQSAVSKYAHGDVTTNDRVVSDERVEALVEELADGLAAGDVTPVRALIEIEILIRELEGRGPARTAPRGGRPQLGEHDASFRVHDPENELRTSERVLSSLRRGLRILENASGFTTLIPAVGSNLVACTPGAEDVDDVAGVPGRIFDVKGQTTVPASPEFGVSEHVATVLLAARSRGAEVSAAINVTYDRELLGALEERGHVAAEFDESEDIASSVAAAIDDEPDATVLYQTGGMGIEPLIYVLGSDAESVADDVRSLS